MLLEEQSSGAKSWKCGDPDGLSNASEVERCVQQSNRAYNTGSHRPV